MKAIFATLTILTLSASAFAQSVVFDPESQELRFERKKQADDKKGRLLDAILQNSDYIQLKDGTVIDVRDYSSSKYEQTDRDSNSVEAINRAIGGSGTGGGG